MKFEEYWIHFVLKLPKEYGFKKHLYGCEGSVCNYTIFNECPEGFYELPPNTPHNCSIVNHILCGA